MNTLPFALRRVHPDGSEEPAGAFPTFSEGWASGQRAVHADRGAAFALYRGAAFALYRGGRRIARFGFNRLMPPAAAGNLDALAGVL
jgi:hypothetical protein